ncbi:MAG: asparaginase [Acidobacteria bacterium]|nr:asparaginase [Acidobacteriota bacterium]
MRINPFFVFACIALQFGILFAQENRELPKVKVVGTGGTIAHIPARGGEPDYYINPDKVIDDFRQDLEGVARVEVEDLFRKGGHTLTMKDFLAVSQRINEIFRQEPGIAGVVVTIGSNGVEEIAYFLSLTVKSDKPVIVTAANRLYTSLSSDSPLNLLNAIRVAASPNARGHEAMAVLNGKINAARGVVKVDTFMDNYQSRDLGILGYVDGEVTFYRSSLRKHKSQSEFDVLQLENLPKVYVLYSYMDADGVLIRAAVQEGKAAGIVMASFPTSSDAPEQTKALEEAARAGVTVVRTNRGGEGRLEIRAFRTRWPLFVSGDSLTPQQARLLLMLALTKTKDPNEIQRIFAEY